MQRHLRRLCKPDGTVLTLASWPDRGFMAENHGYSRQSQTAMPNIYLGHRGRNVILWPGYGIILSPRKNGYRVCHSGNWEKASSQVMRLHVSGKKRTGLLPRSRR